LNLAGISGALKNFLVDLLTDQDFVTTLLEGMYNYQLKRYSLFLQEAGEFLDVVFVGDDLATAESVIMSPKTYRDIIKPYHKEYFKNLKKAGSSCSASLSLLWKYFFFYSRFNRGGSRYLKSGSGFGSEYGY